jgi:hypothetical protein
MVQEVVRAEELAERRRARSVDNAGLEVEEHRAWYALAARGLVVKHVDAVGQRASLSPLYSPSPPMPFSSHNTS